MAQPAKNIAVLACMDHRLHPAGDVGLEDGDTSGAPDGHDFRGYNTCFAGVRFHTNEHNPDR